MLLACLEFTLSCVSFMLCFIAFIPSLPSSEAPGEHILFALSSYKAL